MNASRNLDRKNVYYSLKCHNTSDAHKQINKTYQNDGKLMNSADFHHFHFVDPEEFLQFFILNAHIVNATPHEQL